MMSVVHMSLYRYKKDLKNFLKSFATKKREKAVRTDFIFLYPEEFRGLNGNKCHDFRHNS